MRPAQNLALQMAPVNPLHAGNSIRPSGCRVLLRNRLYRVSTLVEDNFKYFSYD